MRTIRPRCAAALAATCLLVATSMLVAVSCSPEESSDGTASNGSTSSDTTPVCAPEGDESAAKALLRCADGSVLYVETPYASGTGIVIEQGGKQYVLTNLHVVDPFSSASIRRSDGDELAGALPVAGAEVAADIAVLGPIDADDLTSVPLSEVTVDKGDDVFIVGYPGTLSAPDDLDLTITSGLVSRRRDLPAWDQTYVQTDAVVEEGQSGGPMFTSTGALAGVTALGLDDSFSLALQTSDVAASVDRILDGDGDELPLVPTSADDDAQGGELSGTVEMPDDVESPTWFLPPSSEDRTWNLTVSGPEGRFGVMVVDALTGEPLAANAAGVALNAELLAAEAAAVGLSVEDYAGPDEPLEPEVVAAETAPGTFRVEIAADIAAEVNVFVAPDAVPASVQWTSDLELWPLTRDVPVETLELDEPAESVMTSYQFAAPYDIELTEGDTVQVVASSPWADIDVLVAQPGHAITGTLLLSGEDTDWATFLFDSEVGLYGLDVDETYEAPVSGTYRLVIQNFDAVTIATRIEVQSADASDAGDDKGAGKNSSGDKDTSS